MNLELQDKVVMITGASRGIGKAIALGFAEEGAQLMTLQTVRRLKRFSPIH